MFMEKVSKKNNYILAIESSGNNCSIALFSEVLLAQYSINFNNSHDKYLAELTRRILNDFSLEVSELSAVAVSAGPGSFTGIRIGGALAKSLCFDSPPVLIAVPSMDALAYGYVQLANDKINKEILVLTPSHKNLYFARKFANDFSALSEIEVVEKENIPQMISDDTIVIGSGAQAININIGSELFLSPTAHYVGLLGMKYFSEGKSTAGADYLPLYIQDFEPKKSTKTLSI
jgi:tRNA threonylcarbamoyladenosine biosynthesis protein TsaB